MNNVTKEDVQKMYDIIVKLMVWVILLGGSTIIAFIAWIIWKAKITLFLWVTGTTFLIIALILLVYLFKKTVAKAKLLKDEADRKENR